MRNAIAFVLAATAAQSQWFVVRDDTVKPPMLGAYVDAAKARARAGGPPFVTVALTNLHYLTLAASSAIDDAAPFVEQWSAPDAIETRSVAIWRLRPELSYEPAEPRLKPGEEGFIHFDVYAFLPGHQAEVEELTKEYVAVDRDAGVKHRWQVYELIVGSDLPALVLATPARSRADYDAEKIAADALRQNRDMPLHVRNTNQLRHIASFEGAIRRDLSR